MEQAKKMNAKLIIDGKEFDIEILDPKLQELILPTKKKTGYEKVDDIFWFVSDNDFVLDSVENELNEDDNDNAYETANYYSSPVVAENNARADRLMRQLRRFAAENRGCNNPVERYYICYIEGKLQASREISIRYFGPWFDSLQSAVQAIEKFNGELMWYFTKYKDSL